MGVKIIADSGSTKCDWAFIVQNQVHYSSSQGLNPYQKSMSDIRQIISEVKAEAGIILPVESLHFYGSGCNEAMIPQMNKLLAEVFDSTAIVVDSDLMAAAIAAYDGRKCVVSILGTGSNACEFDGNAIKFVHPSLGYVLGDEGSGNHIGRELLKSYFYKTMPDALRVEFENNCNVKDLSVVLERIYHKSAPSSYLASLAPWAIRNFNQDFVIHLVRNCFLDFIHVQLNAFRNTNMPCHFVGSIAFVFKELMENLLIENKLTPGNFIKNPLQRIVERELGQNL
jgi:N-acetylglucosamine kinase-like BadF-type ATPase